MPGLQPISRDDAERWLHKALWTIKETAFLLHGYTPDKEFDAWHDAELGKTLKSVHQKQNRDIDITHHPSIQETYDDIRRAIRAHDLHRNGLQHLRPAEVIAWAADHYPEFPYANTASTAQTAEATGTERMEVMLQQLDRLPSSYSDVLKNTPTLRIWTACIASLGYNHIDKPLASVGIIAIDPRHVTDASGMHAELVMLRYHLDGRVVMTIRNLTCNGGELTVQRPAPDSDNLCDAYIRQSDFWPFAQRMSWNVPEYAREFLNTAQTMTAPKDQSPKAGRVKIRTRAQQYDEAVLAAIRAAEHDPLALPKGEPGRPGVKAEIRAACVTMTLSQFDHAWDRLRAEGKIADKP